MFLKKYFSAVVAGVALLALAASVTGQGRAAGLVRLKNYLALTDAQVAQIAGLMKKHRDAAFPLRQELRAKNHELQNALAQPEPNPNTVGQLVIARRALSQQLRELNLKLRTDIAAVLTPEQKEKFQQLRQRPGEE
jgi:Spy/CpxP family protein refolding chaperone